MDVQGPKQASCTMGPDFVDRGSSILFKLLLADRAAVLALLALKRGGGRFGDFNILMTQLMFLN